MLNGLEKEFEEALNVETVCGDGAVFLVNGEGIKEEVGGGSDKESINQGDINVGNLNQLIVANFPDVGEIGG